MPTFVTPKEAARRLEVSEKTIYRWLRDGTLPGRKLGKAWRISELVLEGPPAEPDRLPAVTRAQRGKPVSILDQLDDVRATLTKFGRVVEGAAENGIEDILGPRRSSERTKREIGTVLEESEGEVLLLGVALREFFGDKDHSLILRRKLVSDVDFRVKALLLDPDSAAARARAVAENGPDFAAEARYRESPLFGDLRRSVSVIRSMREQKASLGKSKFDLEVRFFDCWPTFYLILTTDACFVEPYHMGQETRFLDGSCIGELTPILRLNPASRFYTLLRNHFLYVWEGANPFMRIRPLEEVAAFLFQ